jgi:hypothetical protein
MLNGQEHVLVPGLPERLNPFLIYFSNDIQQTQQTITSQSLQIYIAGPEWCRRNIQQAAKAHAQTIIGAYGNSYALPNKDPVANEQALQDGLKMFLMFSSDNQPITTACMVPDGIGKADLGRAASIGHTGGSLIQDLRILH